MGRYKTLAGNTVIFAICNFTSKLLVFFMLPLYTSVLSKEEFGSADLIMTFAGLLLPILTMGVADGCMRFAMDKTKDTSRVFSFGIKILSGATLLILIAAPFLSRLSFLSGYIVLFLFVFISRMFQTFLGLFARGISRVKLVGISGIVSSFVVVLFNVLLLFIFHLGIKGYLISIVISNFVSAAILFIGCRMNHYLTKEKDVILSKEILEYSIPMVPNSLSWWINHSANRFILSAYCGTGDVGLYSVAAKMPTIIDTFRGIFVQAWQLSTINEYDKNDSANFFKNIYNAYNVFLILLCSVLIMCSKLIARVLYANDFFEAWKITPILIVGVLFGSLVAFYSPTYLAHKKTKMLFLSTFLGAVITIALNLLLVPWMGVYGAAVGSAVAYFAVYLFLHIDSKKYLAIRTNSIRYYFSYLLIATQAVLVTFLHLEPISGISAVIFITLIIINWANVHFLCVLLTNAVTLKIRRNKKNK